MKKDTKIIVIIFGSILMIMIACFLAAVYFNKTKYTWNSYALNYCSDWEAYDIDLLGLEEIEKKAFGVYLLIDKNVIEENHVSSYLECCRVLEMGCIELMDEPGALVKVGEDYRVIRFNYSTDLSLALFKNYKYNETGGLKNGS